MAAYSRTFAAVGVMSMSSLRYCSVLSSLKTPRLFISPITVTGSMFRPKENIENIVSNISRFVCI